MKTNKIIIAGPCSAESEKQVIETAKELKKLKIKYFRASLFKPRTKPGFEGVGLKGCLWAAEVTKMNLIYATEVLLPEHVKQIIQKIKKFKGKTKNLLFWLGARNQNHFIQRKIAQNILKYAPPNVKLIIKNQPWPDEKHWLGIIEHLEAVGFPRKRIILCHRGFSCEKQEGFRNRPDFELALKIKKLKNLPMIIDPSHIGGQVDKVFKIVEEAEKYDFDGYMIEIHPNPEKAYTDAPQQLNLEQFQKLLKLIK